MHEIRQASKLSAKLSLSLELFCAGNLGNFTLDKKTFKILGRGFVRKIKTFLFVFSAPSFYRGGRGRGSYQQRSQGGG
jgi:hypothetical protein